MADLALTMKTVADQTRGAGKAVSLDASTQRARRLEVGKLIPWYIIDPTGMLIKEQRSNAATRLSLDPDSGGERLLCLSPHQTAMFLLRVPTLYPWWDAATAIALIFTALVTPLEVGFLPPATDASNGLWILNRIIDLVFVADMVFQFCTMRKSAVEKAAAEDIEWEMDLKIIARGYLTSVWFPLDVMSIAPSGLEIVPILMGTADSNSGLRAFRTMRSLRLIKLVRLAKSSRIMARAMEYVSLSSTTQTAIGLTLQSLLLTHWFACILMISTTFDESPRNTWLFTHGYCTPDTSGEFVGDVTVGDSGSDDEGGWVCVELSFLYLNAFRWAMGLIYHNTIPMFPNLGPFTPTFVDSLNVYHAPFTVSEDVLLIILKLIGLGFWSLTISKLIHAITVLGNPATIAYQQDIDAVNRFCSFNRLPSYLARDLRRYMYNTREVHAERSRAAIYSKLSPLLVTKVTKLLNRSIFDAHIIKSALTDFPPADGERFVSAIVTASTAAVYSPGDRPPGGRLYLITEGVAIHKLFRLLSVGDCWGDEDVLLGPWSRNMRETKSMTYLRVIWVERSAFRRLEGDFPEPYAKMRLYAIWKRARRILGMVLQKQKSILRNSSGGSFRNASSAERLDSAAETRRILGIDALLDGHTADANLSSAPPPADAAIRGSCSREGAATGAITSTGTMWPDGPMTRVPFPTGSGAGGTAEAAVSLDLRSFQAETLQAVDLVGGVIIQTQRQMAETNEGFEQRMQQMEAIAQGSLEATLRLSQQLEQMQTALGLATNQEEPAPLRTPRGTPVVTPAPANHAGSPAVEVLRRQVAQSRAQFRSMRIAAESQKPSGSEPTDGQWRGGGHGTDDMSQVLC